MGFSDLAAQVIMIFIFIIMISTLFVSYRGFTENMSDDNSYVLNKLNEKVHTHLKIKNLNYDNVSEISYITLKNTGSTSLNVSLIDIFVNGEKIDRDLITRNIFNQTQNTLKWDPSEALNLSFSNYYNGRTLYKVSCENGVSAYEQIIINN
ncbi:MAG: hypothetical protein ACQER9_02200 [Nanobdellota archaeon]